MPTAGSHSRASTEEQSTTRPSKTSSCDSLLFCPSGCPVAAMRHRRPHETRAQPCLRWRSKESEHELCPGHSVGTPIAFSRSLGTSFASTRLNSQLSLRRQSQRAFTEDPPFGGLWCDQPAI